MPRTLSAASVDGQKIGSFGDVVCFSFGGIKNITSGEGGAIFSADPDVIQKVSDARLLGVQKDSEKRYAGKRKLTTLMSWHKAIATT